MYVSTFQTQMYIVKILCYIIRVPGDYEVAGQQFREDQQQHWNTEKQLYRIIWDRWNCIVFSRVNDNTN